MQSAWKLYIYCAAATPVSGTRVASGLHPGTPKGVKVYVHLEIIAHVYRAASLQPLWCNRYLLIHKLNFGPLLHIVLLP